MSRTDRVPELTISFLEAACIHRTLGLLTHLYSTYRLVWVSRDAFYCKRILISGAPSRNSSLMRPRSRLSTCTKLTRPPPNPTPSTTPTCHAHPLGILGMGRTGRNLIRGCETQAPAIRRLAAEGGLPASRAFRDGDPPGLRGDPACLFHAACFEYGCLRCLNNGSSRAPVAEMGIESHANGPALPDLGSR